MCIKYQLLISYLNLQLISICIWCHEQCKLWIQKIILFLPRKRKTTNSFVILISPRAESKSGLSRSFFFVHRPCVNFSYCHLFSRATLPILTRLGTTQSWSKGNQGFFFLQMKGHLIFQGKNNNAMRKVH